MKIAFHKAHHVLITFQVDLIRLARFFHNIDVKEPVVHPLTDIIYFFEYLYFHSHMYTVRGI